VGEIYDIGFYSVGFCVSYLTPAEVAAMLRVSPKTISRWVLRDSSMPVTRVGRVVRFEVEALERWLRAHARRKTGSDAAQVSVRMEKTI
jgi:excisionase family DNA binding protein